VLYDVTTFVHNRAPLEKDATASARVATADLVTQLLVAASVRQVSQATNVKTVARQVCQQRTSSLNCMLVEQ